MSIWCGLGLHKPAGRYDHKNGGKLIGYFCYICKKEVTKEGK